MRKITFSDGFAVVTNLTTDEAVKRLNKLDTLRVLTEGYEEGDGFAICKKAVRAYRKNPFTGIIRLSVTEKDFLCYILEENPYLDEDEKSVLRFYIYGKSDQ